MLSDSKKTLRSTESIAYPLYWVSAVQSIIIKVKAKIINVTMPTAKPRAVLSVLDMRSIILLGLGVKTAAAMPV